MKTIMHGKTLSQIPIISFLAGVLLSALTVGSVGCTKKKKKEVTEKDADPAPAEETYDFVKTSKAYQPSEYLQVLSTESGYMSVGFISPNSSVVVTAQPDSFTNYSGEPLGTPGSISIEDEQGNAVTLEDDVTVELSVPSASISNNSQLRIIVEIRNEVGEVLQSFSISDLIVEELSDGTTRLTFMVGGSRFAFAPIVLGQDESEVDGFPETSESEDDNEPQLLRPAAPSSVSVTAASSSLINMTWADNSSNELSFEIERSLDNLTYATLVSKAANSASHGDSTVAASTSYYYRVRACNAQGCSAYASSTQVTSLAPGGGYQSIFVTSTSYSGILGGISGADAKCQARADAEALGGSWKAILSIGGQHAINRIVISGEVRNLNNNKVADNSADFWDGTLDSAVGYDETGAPTSVSVWTSTDELGSASANNCSNWTSDDGGGYSGDSGLSQSTSSTWLSNTDLDCGSGNARLYCINGQTP